MVRTTKLLQELTSPLEPSVGDETPLGPHHARVHWGPLAPGLAETLGNALRRVMLGSLPGCAITEVRLPGVPCDLARIPGLETDVQELLLRLRGVVFRLHGQDSAKLLLRTGGETEITAGNSIATPHCVEVLNPDHVLGRLAPGGAPALEMQLERGVGHVPAKGLHRPLPDGSTVIALDAWFSPVRRVHWAVQPLMTGPGAGGERLVLEVETNGSLEPGEAVHRAAALLAAQTQALAAAFAPTEPRPFGGGCPGGDPVPPALRRSIDELGLTLRCLNSLKAEGIVTIHDLLLRSETDLLRTPHLGRSNLEQIKAALAERGLCLGLRLESHQGSRPM